MRVLHITLATGILALTAYLVTRKKLPSGSVSVSEEIDGVQIETFLPNLDSFTESAPTLEFADDFGLWDDIVNTAADVSNWFHPRGLQYKPLFDAAEKKYGIPNGLLFRQSYQESRFREDIITGKVRSTAGAVGIMQIVPKWHPDIGEAGALNPAIAVPYAAKLLAGWRKQFGSWQLALAAYNAGPGNVQKYKGIPPFTETQNYVAQITRDVQVNA